MAKKAKKRTYKFGFHWNHRVVRRKFRRKHSSETTYSIHEAYYRPGRKKVPNAITVDPVDPHGNTLKELRQSLEWMLVALEKPVLEYTEYVKPPKKVKKKKFCCEWLRSIVEFKCVVHADSQCPDKLIIKTEHGYAMSIKDGGDALIPIRFCPLCGTEFK